MPKGSERTLSTNRQCEISAAAVFAAMKDPVRLALWRGSADYTNRTNIYVSQGTP